MIVSRERLNELGLSGKIEKLEQDPKKKKLTISSEVGSLLGEELKNRAGGR